MWEITVNERRGHEFESWEVHMVGFGVRKGNGKCNFIKFSKIEKYNNIFLWFLSKCSYLLSHISSLLIYSLSNVV